jgi:hypothetical protein
MASAPPIADTKKPAKPPESEKKDGRTGTTKAAEPKAAGKQGGGAAKNGAGKGAAQAGSAEKVTPQKRVDRMAVRAKMAVSEPGDAVEKEADQVADKVSRKMAEPDQAKAGADQKKDGAP